MRAFFVYLKTKSRDVTDRNTFSDQVPNPSKVLIILEELNLPYETSWVELDGLKQKPYTDVNPNGRVPAIEDPNHGVTLWESGAIVQVSPPPSKPLQHHTFYAVSNQADPSNLVPDRHVRQGQQDIV